MSGAVRGLDGEWRTGMERSYEIVPRPAAVGGGWKLVLLEDGEEAGGGVFPAAEDAYEDAMNQGQEWASVTG